MADLQNVTYGSQTFTIPTYDDTALAARVTANEMAISGKQDELVSGTNIKTLNGESLLGSGNIEVDSGQNALVILQGITTPQEIWNAINMGRALLFKTSAGITKSVLSASATTTEAAFICATDSGEGIVTWSVDSNATYTLAVTTFATDAELAAKQDALVSGTNIKTVNGQSVLGSGNVVIRQGVGDSLDKMNMPTLGELQQALDNHALLYIDGNWLVTKVSIDGSNAIVYGEYAEDRKLLTFDAENPYSPLVYLSEHIQKIPEARIEVSINDIFYYAKVNDLNGDILRISNNNADGTLRVEFEDRLGNVTQDQIPKMPTFAQCKDDVGGNVVRVGSIEIDGADYGIYEFYYRTSALPNTTTKDYSLTTLLADYTILDFMDAHGVTSNGVYVGSGRTDGTNRVIVQRFSKNNKTFTMQTYQDFSAQTARLCIKFIGTKNA